MNRRKILSKMGAFYSQKRCGYNRIWIFFSYLFFIFFSPAAFVGQSVIEVKS